MSTLGFSFRWVAFLVVVLAVLACSGCPTGIVLCQSARCRPDGGATTDAGDLSSAPDSR